MKCIIASPVACYPSAAGNAERVRQLHACLENLGYEVHFVLCPIQAMSTQLNEPAMKQIFGDRFHHLDNHPRPLQNALINFKRRYYHRIHKTGWLFDFMLSDGYVSRQSCQTFNQLVNDIEPDLILLVYGFMSPLLKHLNNRCKVLVDAQDKFSYRNRGIRQAGSEGYWLSLLPWQERYLLSQSDIVLAIQEQEGQYFKRLLATTPAEVVTLDILVAPDQPEATPSKNPVIGFLASGNQHNTEGLQRFIAQVWPSLLAQCPHAVLKVAGSVTKNITTDADNVELVGWVDDLKTFYQQCRLIINPCETGSGLKIKTIEAVGFGIPVVSTPCGAAGVEFLLPEENVQDLISPAFTHRCLTLLRDEDEAHQQANLCFQRLHQRVKHNRTLLASLLQDS